MNQLMLVMVAALLLQLLAIANEVRKRQRIGARRDELATDLMTKQGELQLMSMRQMNRLTQLSIERSRRENAKLDEGESWKEGG